MNSPTTLAAVRGPHPLSRRLTGSMGSKRMALGILIIGAWWLASFNAPPYIFPTPARTLQALTAMINEGNFFNDIRVTLGRVCAGFVLAALIGAPLGIALGSNRKLGEFFEPILAVVNTVSSAIWAIFALIWFGISDQTTIFVVFMTSMPLILTNVWQGTQTVNADFIELARTFRMSRSKIMWKIYVPTILPYFFSGARLAFGFGWRVSLVAETIGSTSGIGYRLRQAADLVQTDQVFAWTATLVTMMLILEMGILKPLENHLFRWKKHV
jgi:NitT/TauT family transport system permease protein